MGHVIRELCSLLTLPTHENYIDRLLFSSDCLQWIWRFPTRHWNFLVTCHKILMGFYSFISEITVFLKMKQDFTDKKYEMAPRSGIFNLYYESSKWAKCENTRNIKFSNVIMWQYGSFSGNMSSLGNAKMWKYSTLCITQVILVGIHQSSGKTATQKILDCQELNLKISFKIWAFWS